MKAKLQNIEERIAELEALINEALAEENNRGRDRDFITERLLLKGLQHVIKAEKEIKKTLERK